MALARRFSVDDTQWMVSTRNSLVREFLVRDSVRDSHGEHTQRMGAQRMPIGSKAAYYRPFDHFKKAPLKSNDSDKGATQRTLEWQIERISLK